MSKTEHKLSNGKMFLAVSSGHYGYWAKATDPITAIKDVVKREGQTSTGILVMVLYGDSETLNCGPMGGFDYSATQDGRPTPIGLFTCKGRTIKPTKKGDFGADHSDHEGWMNETAKDIAEQCEYRSEKA